MRVSLSNLIPMMLQQLSLNFVQQPPPAIGRSRRQDPSTSKAAARVMNPTSLRALILDALRETGGLTIEELTRWLVRKEVSISPRLRELERKGFVYRAGTRLNGTGCHAIIWKVL